MDGWDKKPDNWEETNIYYNITNSKNIKSNFNISNYDGIFVLAGGIDNEGKCYPWILKRLDCAYKLYKEINKPIFCLGGGSYHTKPILNKNGYVIHETTSCSEYLIKLGVNPENIYKEWGSYDTIANGFFAFTNFILPMNLKSIFIITSNFHMNRTIAIFNWMKNCFNCSINIKYISVEDDDLDSTLLKIREEREANSLINLKKNVIKHCNTLEKFHKWFYTEHKAYCSNSELIRKNDITDNEKKTY